MENIGFYLYLLFTISWFVHLAARIPVLGYIRFDFILVLLLFCIMMITNLANIKEIKKSEAYRNLTFLIIYMVFATPFAKWPGSVVKYGAENFLKAVVFFYFTVAFVNSERKFKTFIQVFLGCQIFRVAEPVFLHVFYGYWGDRAAMLHGEQWMVRLSGAPNDIVNPNGLAFIILTIMSFMLYMWKYSKGYLLVSIVTIPMLFYALNLTASRSGFIGMLVIMLTILYKSKKRHLLVPAFIFVLALMFINMTPNLVDRYKSILDTHTKNASTAEYRIQGVIDDFEVALRRPIFGFGLGTSREANAHYGQEDKLAHNLYAEVAQELGFVGLLIFIRFMYSVVKNFISYPLLDKDLDENRFLYFVNKAMFVWIVMDVIFSFASYGLSGYGWYLFGGLSISYAQIIKNKKHINTKKVKFEI